MTMSEVDSSFEWSREQDIAFETALEKPLEEILREYDLFIDNVSLNESDYVPLQSYNSPPEISTNLASEKGVVKKETKTSKSNQERRKTIHWTEDEHRLFLKGLEMYGEGDWKSISRNYVVTRTPTQVASHAQKYKIHQKSMNPKKERRRRSSIHDVTLEKNRDISEPQGPITCQASNYAACLAAQSAAQVPPPPSAEMFAAVLTAGRYAAALNAEMFGASLPASRNL